MSYQEYLLTDYWKAVSAAVKKNAGYRCQVCNSPHDLEAHHRSYAHRGNELEHLSDLTCLCRRCHGIFHGRQETENPKKSETAPASVSVLITDLNFRSLKYNKETWQWMKRNGLKPKKAGWNRRAIGHSVPERFLW